MTLINRLLLLLVLIVVCVLVFLDRASARKSQLAGQRNTGTNNWHIVGNGFGLQEFIPQRPVTPEDSKNTQFLLQFQQGLTNLGTNMKLSSEKIDDFDLDPDVSYPDEVNSQAYYIQYRVNQTSQYNDITTNFNRLTTLNNEAKALYQNTNLQAKLTALQAFANAQPSTVSKDEKSKIKTLLKDINSLLKPLNAKLKQMLEIIGG